MGELKQLRQKHILTQQELAKRADLSMTTISRIQTGKVTAEPYTIRRLAEGLGLTAQEVKKYLDGERRIMA